MVEVLGSIFDILLIGKIISLVIIFGYIIFSFVIFQQVRIMNDIISHSSSRAVEVISIIHIVASASLFLFALAIL